MRSALCSGLRDLFLLQLRPEEDTEGQAEVGVFEVTAEQLRDVGEAIQKGRAVQVERRRCFGDGEVVVEIDAQRLQIGDLRAFVVRLQLFQSVRVIDPGRSACQRTGEKLRQQIVLKVKDCAVSVLQKSVLQRAGRLKPRLIGLIQIGKRAGYTADQTEPVQQRQQLRCRLALGLRGRAVGAALQACLDAVMDETLPNDRAALLGYAAENLQRFANS